MLFGALVSKCILSFSGYIHSHFLNSRWVCVILSILALMTLRPNSKLPSFAATRTVDFSTILTYWMKRKTIFLSMEVGTFRGGNHNMNQNFVFKQEFGRLCPPLERKNKTFFGGGAEVKLSGYYLFVFFVVERSFHTKVTVFKKGNKKHKGKYILELASSPISILKWSRRKQDQCLLCWCTREHRLG